MAIKITNEDGAIVDTDVTGKFVDGEPKRIISKPIPKTAVVRVPMSLIVAMQKIGAVSEFEQMEYALVFEVKEIDKLTYEIVDGSHYLPKQTVTPTTVRILTDSMTKEELTEFNKCTGVVHRHPAGVENFSNTDDINLNKLFNVSLLFLKNYKVPRCIVNVALDSEIMLQVNATIEVYGTCTEPFSMVLKDNIGVLLPVVSEEEKLFFLKQISFKQYTIPKEPVRKSVYGHFLGFDGVEDLCFLGLDDSKEKPYLSQKELDNLKANQDVLIEKACNQGGVIHTKKVAEAKESVRNVKEELKTRKRLLKNERNDK